MENGSFAPTTLNFGSNSDEGSPFKRSCCQDDIGSPVRGMPIFGSAYDESPVKGFTLFGYLDEPSTKTGPPKMPPAPRKTKLGLLEVEKPIDLLLGDDKGKEKEKEEFPFVPATYEVNLTQHAPSVGIKTPMPQFFKGLENAGSISPITTPIPSTREPIKNGSFLGFCPSPDGLHAIKTATVGSDGVGTLDKKRLVKVINDTVICNGSPQCAKVDSLHIDHTDMEGRAKVIIVQELCQPLQNGDAIPFLVCVISVSKCLIAKGFYPTDLKRDNFGKDKDGNVKWFDFDLKEFVSTNACFLIKSGEFQHDGNPIFQQFILMLMDFYRQIEENRKSEFAKLNKQAGLLKSLGLLSSEKSVSETTIEDFREVLRRIGLSEEDIAYLVGLIVPPASSQ
jgi:hypothetical protein